MGGGIYLFLIEQMMPSKLLLTLSVTFLTFLYCTNMRTLLIASILILSRSAYCQPCAENRYSVDIQVGPWLMDRTNDDGTKVKTLIWYVPVGFIKKISDTAYLVPHPDKDDFCKEAADTVFDTKRYFDKFRSRNTNGEMPVTLFYQNGIPARRWNFIAASLEDLER